MQKCRHVFCGLALMVTAVAWRGTAAEPVEVAARDSIEAVVDDGSAAGRALGHLVWTAGEFVVRIEETPEQDYDARIIFASPRPSGDAGIDTVVLRWYRPPAPAPGNQTSNESPEAELNIPGVGPKSGVLLVHSLHPDLPVATMLARGLRQRGIHAFVIELPGYASRVGAERRMTGVTTLLHAAQAVADCRRAFDAIVALHAAGLTDVDAKHLAIQGTSLGSFFAASAAAIDGCFSQTFLLLSGGNGVDILESGQKDAHHMRGALRHYGYTGDKLRALIDPVEPLHLAPRLNPQTTWMFNARDDLVVPAKNARLLAEAIGLDASHHVWMPGNHYTSFILLPGVLDRIGQEMNVAATEVPEEADNLARQREPHPPVVTD